MARKHVCPTCRKSVPSADESQFPFCSERCRLIDLGHWLEGGYRLPGSDVEAPFDDNPVN